jgi:1-phosphofructokinase family hexose kinase
MILSVTPNPGIDHVVIVPGFKPGQAITHPETHTVAAGKGVSMARAARTLGADPVCAGFLGGFMGRLHIDLTTREGLKTAWTWLDAETRTCTIIADTEQGIATVINEPGPTVSAADWARLCQDVWREAAQASYVSFSGSLPPGSSTEVYGDLIRALMAAGRSVFVDSSGDALRAALAARPTAIKVNGLEAGAILGRPVKTVAEALEAAAELRQRGIDLVALTLGERGAVMVSKDGQWMARPPRLQHIVSAVGSGDSFFAGLVSSLEAGLALAEALCRAVAAGAANALSAAAGEFQASQFAAILAESVVEKC